MLSSDKPKELVKFYVKVFGKEPDMDEDSYSGFSIGNCFLSIGPHDKVDGKNKNPERFILNFETKDVKIEFARIKNLGVKVIAEPYQMEGWDGWIATLEDPDGNYFQLMTPWEEDNK